MAHRRPGDLNAFSSYPNDSDQQEAGGSRVDNDDVEIGTTGSRFMACSASFVLRPCWLDVRDAASVHRLDSVVAVATDSFSSRPTCIG